MLCLMNSTNNVIQQPSLFTRQVIITFGYHNAKDDLDGRLTETILEMNNPDRDPDISNVAMVLKRCGWLKPFVINEQEHLLRTYTKRCSRSDFISQNPSAFWLAGEVSLEAGKGQLHFEGVTYKAGCYWILVGIHNTNIIRLGDLATTADLLFTQSGRN